MKCNNMLDNNREQNEFNESLYYQSDTRKKIIKMVVIILAVLAVLSGVLFIFLRNKSGPANIQTADMPFNNNSAISQTTNDEEVKKVEEQLVKFANDKDRDGLSAEKEKELGTSDNDFDTDWDGISDKDEIEKWGTDPLKTDTDGDNYSDGFEIINDFNPKGQGKL